MGYFQKKAIFGLFLSIFLFAEAYGTCLRCKKIEEEREKEQALHPQTVGYYDDENQSKDKNREKNTHKAEEKSIKNL